MSSGKSDQAMLAELALAILGHEPTPTEASALLEHVRKASSRRKGWEDVAWAMINSKEFLLRH
jgi:hypothetical protein